MDFEKYNGMQIPVLGGRALLSAEHTQGDVGPGILRLELEDASTLEAVQPHLGPTWLDDDAGLVTPLADALRRLQSLDDASQI